ncbi:hypothetical protein FHS82_002171 [Pseudochelatococcus lubricantis]|uniref:Adenylate cyclase n=1 Tax=Pseudochelatococcus lubricantis TaxID=1538102 RepID=A0ABX0V2K0_9HYPH|nr:DUF3095 family protein [Pseudochelatococcus lubricantis]NIJ58329.1 hypothetical protein [Pseudochelatococcus lubricantis]
MDETATRQVRTYDDFDSVLDFTAYDAVPDDWLIGITDVVDSTAAIRRGAYQDVNVAGVSVIAAIGNILGNYDFPFTFSGDGAAFAVPDSERVAATRALTQVVASAQSDFGLLLRGGLIPVSDIRANGHDVRIARYAASARATYSMFAGGGLKWAEAELKSGHYAIVPDAATPRPDLTGLSCEWTPIPNRNGTILSLLVEPLDNTAGDVFAALARRILAVFAVDPRRGHPLPETVPALKDGDRRVAAEEWLSIASNSDFRKYDDLLRLTLDCSQAQADAVEELLRDAAARGQVRYGAHRQTHALMTCLVPSTDPAAHRHFLDGMDGGYARAADMLKAGRHR